MQDFKITKQDFIDNNGYSSHCFFEHSVYFLLHSKDIAIDYWRKKLVLSYNNKQLIIRCHYNKRSKHYATILTPDEKEILTFRDTVEPRIVNKIINLLLK